MAAGESISRSGGRGGGYSRYRDYEGETRVIIQGERLIEFVVGMVHMIFIE